MNKIIPFERIKQNIFVIRDEKVMLDGYVAMLYGVDVKQLRRQVRKNLERFPDDFAFRLTKKEIHALRSCFSPLKRRAYSQCLPYAFTAYGVVMLSSILSGERAVHVHIEIIRALHEEGNIS